MDSWPSSAIAKTDENKISECGLFITKTDYYKVSCGVVVVSVLKAWWTKVEILQARCVSCRQSGGGQLGGGGGSLEGAQHWTDDETVAMTTAVG